MGKLLRKWCFFYKAMETMMFTRGLEWMKQKMTFKKQRTKLPALPSVWNPPLGTCLCPWKLPFHARSKPASSSVEKYCDTMLLLVHKENEVPIWKSWLKQTEKTEKTFIQIVQSLQRVHFTIWVQFPSNWMTLHKQFNCFRFHFSISQNYLQQERL